MTSTTSRTPPTSVIRELRQEVGFRCPIDVAGRPCGSPYLTWHHFDPPWRVEQHHRPEGMVALCQEHHRKADAGAFTVEQLRVVKQVGVERAELVRGRFDWMRRDYLSIVGGNAYIDTPVLLEIQGVPAVWFTRNAQEETMLNFDFGGARELARVAIRDNFWTVSPRDVRDMKCPPSGKEILVHFKDGDVFHTRFTEIESPAQLAGAHAWTGRFATELTYPLTAVELWERQGGPGVKLSPHGTFVPGGNMFQHGFIKGGRTAVSIENSTPASPAPVPEWQLMLNAEFTRLYGPDGYKPGNPSP